MNPKAVLELCREHSAAEAVLDIDRILATLAPEPRFEFFPLCKAVSGMPIAERFYRNQFPLFAAQVASYEVLDEWANEHAALQEYVICVRGDDGRAKSYHVMSMMPVDDETGLMAGERVFCDEGLVHVLLGPLIASLEPIAP
jgi:hypothetical protein